MEIIGACEIKQGWEWIKMHFFIMTQLVNGKSNIKKTHLLYTPCQNKTLYFRIILLMSSLIPF